MALPKILLNDLEQGNAILFLGAGASYGSINSKNEKIPMGRELGNMIANQFLDSSYIDNPLAFISELAISQSDLFRVQKYVYDIIEPFQPTAFHKLIPTFRWRSIYTTNYDFIIERAYDSAKNPIQELSPVIRNTKVTSIYKDASTLPYYKIHGCLSAINDPELPLILTPEQYIDHKKTEKDYL